jgi:hypothetical protein
MRWLIAAVSLLAAAAGSTTLSGASFTSASKSPGSRVTAAADWVAPTVSLADPGSPLRGTVALSASASDAGSGVASVSIQRSPAAAGTWSTICAKAAAPYMCSLDTAALADGRYDLRATATDAAGNTATSPVLASRLVDNAGPQVTLAGPGANVRGTVTLTAAADDGGSGGASVRIQRALNGSTTWTDVCTVTAAPYACAWNTTTLADDQYDLRAIATDALGNQSTSAVVSAVQVDNTAPTVAMIDPGATLSGTVTLAATASDADSGVDRVTVQISAAGKAVWSDACAIMTSPYNCRYDTTKLADGLYDLRAVALDAAGNSATSSTVTGRRIDNSVSTVSMEDPGAYLRGTVSLTASANSTAGVSWVTIERAPAGQSTFTTVCTPAAAPYTCQWNTTAVADGLYDFRARMVTGTGVTQVSAVLSNRRVDNSPVRGIDVQAGNATGGAIGRFEPGDRLTLTYSRQMAPGSLIAGWSGSSPASVYARLRDGSLVGGSSAADVVQLTSDATGLLATGLGSVNLQGDYIRSGRTVTFAATAALSTTQVNGVTASVVTITLGAQSGGGLRTSSKAVAMQWTPAAAATDLLGSPCSSAPVTESGTLDVDF